MEMGHRNAGYGTETNCLTRKDILKRQHMLHKLPPSGSVSAMVNKGSWKKITLGTQYGWGEEHNLTVHVDGSENTRFQDQERRGSKFYSETRIDPVRDIAAGAKSRAVMKDRQLQTNESRPGDNWQGNIGRAPRGEDGRMGHQGVAIDFVPKKAKGLFSMAEQPTNHLAHDAICETRFLKRSTKRAFPAEQRPKERIWKFDPNSRDVNPEMPGGIKRGAGTGHGESAAADCIYGRACADAAMEDHNVHFAKKKIQACYSSHKIFDVMDRGGMDRHLDSKRQQAWKEVVTAGYVPGDKLEQDHFRSTKQQVEGRSAHTGNTFCVVNPPWADQADDDGNLGDKYTSTAHEAQERILAAQATQVAQERVLRAHEAQCTLLATQERVLQRSQSARFSTTSRDSAAPSRDRARTPPPRSDAGSYAALGSRSSRDVSPFMYRGAREATPTPSVLQGTRSSRDLSPLTNRGGEGRRTRDTTPTPSVLTTQSVDSRLSLFRPELPPRIARRQRSARGLTPPRTARSVTPQGRAPQGTPPRRDPRSQSGMEGSQSVRELPPASTTSTRYSL